MDYMIREMWKEEYPLLKDFLYEAVYVPEGVDPPNRAIIDSPELQMYIRGFGNSRHDHAMVAVVDGDIAGVVWARIMDDYGHINDETPSLAISVHNGYRNSGIGTALLKEMLLYMKMKGYPAVSLSVQKANYAVRMYQKAGFCIVKENDEEYVMAAQL